METSSFNLVSTTTLLQKRWRTIALFAAVTVFVMPQYFRSTAVIVSANPMLADKARLFNTNIQNLYSYFGSGDDLDRIYGVADMNSTYEKLVDEFLLISYYHLTDDSLAVRRLKAVAKLRKDLYCQKTEEGQLKIIAWTKDKQLSADLVNRMVSLVEEAEAGIWQKNYSRSSEKLATSIALMEHEYSSLNDSVSTLVNAKRELAVTQMQILLEQIKQYRKTAGEFTLASQTPPAVLYVMEPGKPAAKAERPDKMFVILAACLAGFIFSCLLVLVNDRKSMA
jgi:hypothetical protein